MFDCPKDFLVIIKISKTNLSKKKIVNIPKQYLAPHKMNN